MNKYRIHHGPGPLNTEELAGRVDGFAPVTARGMLQEDLVKYGLVFMERDFWRNDSRPFMEEGLVSGARSVIVMFCDLKGSTPVLRALGPHAFMDVQREFFTTCLDQVRKANTLLYELGGPPPRVIIDKFMGDGLMLFFDLGMRDRRAKAVDSLFDFYQTLATRLAMRLVLEICKALEGNILEGLRRGNAPKLGARFGIAMGDDVTISLLGFTSKQPTFLPGSFTVTGVVANLAARLEHATPAEFLMSFAEEREHLASYTRLIDDPDRMRGTVLGEDLRLLDHQVLDLHSICKKNLEIRANHEFKSAFERRKGFPPECPANPEARSLTNDDISLDWRCIPFKPRGFDKQDRAWLLGGDTVSELFRVL